MKMDMIAVGSEAKYRNHFDAAYQYLKKEAASVGASVENYHILRAEPTALFKAVRDSMQKNEVVCLLAAPEPEVAGTILKIVCSGLELDNTIDPTLEKQVELRASLLGRKFTFEELASFASFPVGARVIKNPAGLVQGYAITAKKQVLLVLPAVPSELSTLYSSEVRPILAGYSGVAASYGMVRVLEIDSFSVPEELRRLAAEHKDLHLSCQQSGGDYEIYIEAVGSTQEKADSLKNCAIQKMRDRFGIYLYCIGNQPLPAIVSEGLTKNNLSLAAAELGVNGSLQELLSSTWGARAFFRDGFRDEEVRQEMHLPHKLLSEGDGSSAALAAAMAVQARKMNHASLGVGICCRCPEEASGGERVRVVVALADKRKIWTKRLEVAKARGQKTICELAAWQALNMVRLYAAQYPSLLPGGVDVSKVEKRLLGLPSLFSHKKSASEANPSSFAEDTEAGNIKEKETGTMKLSSPKNSKAKKSPAKVNISPAGDPAAQAVKGTNLIQRLKMRRLTKGDKTRLGVLALCLVVFLACIIYIISVKMESVNNEKLSQELAGLFGSDVKVENYPKDYIPGFEALYAQNPDIAGWITMPDSKLNYAVMQAADNKKYDRTDFYLKSNQHGIPFADFRVDLKKPSFNTILYSHNMDDGQMFGELTNFKRLAYYQSHPIVNFKSVYRDDQYKIFAVVVCKANDPDFDYHNFVDSNSAAAIDDYLHRILERSLIKTTVDVKNTDRLLTLSTCDYSFRDPDTNKQIARLVVFARAVRPGEKITVNTDAAILNPNPKMPKEWFDYIQKLQEKKAAEALEKEQKAYINLWLTEAEKVGTVQEQYELAQQRAADAETHLTPTELASGMTPDEILKSINYRKKLFNLLISGQESALAVENKLSLCTERSSVLSKYFSDEEMWSINSWDVLEHRYKVISDPSSGKFLTYEEIKDTSKTSGEQIDLMRQRQAEVQKYLTPDQIDACKNWQELSAKTAEAKANRANLEKKARELGFKQEEIDRMSVAELKAAIDKKLNQGKIDEIISQIKTLAPDATGANGKQFSEMSLDELSSFLGTLQNERAGLEEQAKKYGIPQDKLASYPSNAALSEAVKAQKGTYDKLLSDLISKYPDKKAELEKLSYNELLNYDSNVKTEMEQLKKEAESVGMTKEEIAKYTDAASLRAAIEEKKKANQDAALKAEMDRLKKEALSVGMTEEEIAKYTDPGALRAAIEAKKKSGAGGGSGDTTNPKPQPPAP